MAGGGQEQLIKHTAKTFQATEVAFVVEPFATCWILARLIGDKVGAVNAGFDPFIMPKNKFDLLRLQRLNHCSISFDCFANVFFAGTPPSTQD